MLVNYFRGGPDARTQLSRQDRKVAVPTSYLKATELEGTRQTERDVSDSKLAKALQHWFQAWAKRLVIL